MDKSLHTIYNVRWNVRYTVECRYNAVQYRKLLYEWFAGTQAEYQSDAGSTKDGRAMGCLLWIFFWENWSRYNGTALYKGIAILCAISIWRHDRAWNSFHITHCKGIPCLLTLWGRDKMAAIFQTTFSNTLPWMKMHEFWLKVHWILFPGVQLTIFRHWFR